MTTNELATRNTNMANLALPDLFKLGDVLVTTGFLPDAIKTPAQAVAVMLKGQELGVPPMYALSNIGIIHGKPVCQAELMLALIYRDQGDQALTILETNERICRVRYKRRGGSAGEMSFTIEEAAQAGLLQQNANFKKYPAAMLRARVISATARAAFPDSIAGMYTPDELGARVTVNDNGEVVLDEEPLAIEPPKAIAAAVKPSQKSPRADTPPTIEELRDSWAALWNAAQKRQMQVEDIDILSLDYDGLMAAGKALKARIEAHDSGVAA